LRKHKNHKIHHGNKGCNLSITKGKRPNHEPGMTHDSDTHYSSEKELAPAHIGIKLID
jgi:hypothetical protein